MNIITIPDDLTLEHSHPLQVFDYKNSHENIRQQIVFKTNTFSFLIEGTKEIVFESSMLHTTNSKFLVMKSGQCLMTEKLSDNKNYRSVLLFFSNNILLKFLGKIKPSETQLTKYPPISAFEYDEYILRFVNSLVDIAKLSKDVKSKLLKVKFEEIMLYMLEMYGTRFLNFILTDNSDSSQKFLQIMESNKLNKLTIKELSFLCNMSVSKFKRKFKEHYSEPPSKWFQNKRLEHAHYLLNQENKNSSEIYFEVGYENLSSFIQAYKSKYGVTPKQHHKNLNL